MKRAKKSPPAPPPAPPNGRRGVRRVLAVLVGLAAAAAVVVGLSAVGDAARRRIAGRDRYAVPFADIRCDPPPGVSRETFLTEVRYASGAPATVQLLDPQLPATLTAALAAHPWVQNVESVTVEPPDVIRVALTYRTPVLCVPQRSGARAVDARGVLLPPSAPTDGLPELLGPPDLPEDAVAGKPWPADAVVRAAAVAAEYRPRTLERIPQGWQLVMPDGRKLLVAK